MINSILSNICNDNEIQHIDDIEIKQAKKEKIQYEGSENIADDMKWLQDWSIMVDCLSDNDILQNPHGSCVNSSYQYRLHPHTIDIYDQPMDVTWESSKIDKYSNPYYLNETNYNSTQNNEIHKDPDAKSNPFTLTKHKKQQQQAGDFPSFSNAGGAREGQFMSRRA